MTGTIAAVLALSIPIIAIITNHRQNQARIKGKHIQEELELEKLKHENFLLETEKLRLELEKQVRLDSPEGKKVL